MAHWHAPTLAVFQTPQGKFRELPLQQKVRGVVSCGVDLLDLGDGCIERG